MHAYSAMHRILPFESYVRVTNVVRKKSVIVRINDRGPFIEDCVIDLSVAAASLIGLRGSGSAEATLEPISAAKARAEISDSLRIRPTHTHVDGVKHKKSRKTRVS
ncbi:rare lipoprotein A [Candidatus Burkholderia pumila]|uniref:Rare lipoprotein A n=1 Tax=Candidatus Burkholderia pumila TaxID=1090375 RepID=A0ABR5HJX3_9BURK|nr:rare lipoprotein A [Candidatus Burkholderia pumila]